MNAPFAVFDDYHGLVAALRRRKNDLNLSDVTVDELANLAAGHTGKLLGAAEVKRLGPLSLFAICYALSVKVALVEDPEAMEKIAEFGEKRKRPPYATLEARALGTTALSRVRPAVLSELSKLGNQARQCKIPAARRSSIARNAANARWKQRRQQRRRAKHSPAAAAETND